MREERAGDKEDREGAKDQLHGVTLSVSQNR